MDEQYRRPLRRGLRVAQTGRITDELEPIARADNDRLHGHERHPSHTGVDENSRRASRS
jgi:hypothetical protein